MGDECSVWFNAVVRGDVAPITIGNRTNIQDGACVHVTNTTGPTIIGSDVTIGHNATVHACTIRDGALVGMGATLLDNCEVGEGAIVAAGALVGAESSFLPQAHRAARLAAVSPVIPAAFRKSLLFIFCYVSLG